MIRRLFLALIGAVVIVCGITACTVPTTESRSTGVNTYITPPPDWPSSAPVSDTPADAPAQIDNSLVLTSKAFDTSKFDRPAVVMGWDIHTSDNYASVTVGITAQDWKQLAEQLKIDPQSDPLRVQPEDAAVTSLIDVDKTADKILQERQADGYPAFDIRKTETYYYLTVVN